MPADREPVPPPSTTERALGLAFVAACFALVLIAAVALSAGAEWERALLDGPSTAVLASALILASARAFFFDAARGPHPRRRRAFALVSALIGLRLVAYAVTGA